MKKLIAVVTRRGTGWISAGYTCRRCELGKCSPRDPCRDPRCGCSCQDS